MDVGGVDPASKRRDCRRGRRPRAWVAVVRYRWAMRCCVASKRGAVVQCVFGVDGLVVASPIIDSTRFGRVHATAATRPGADSQNRRKPKLL